MHHLWESVFVACESVGRCVFPDGKLQNALLNLRYDQPALNEAWAGLATGGASTVFVNHACGSVLSYPMYNPWQFPDLNNYGAAAAANGDRLKVIVMLRNADDLYNSVNRAWGRQAKDIVSAARVMLEQLALFAGAHPDSWICIDHEELPGAALSVDEFLGSPGARERAFNLTLAVHEIYSPGRASTCRAAGCKVDPGVRAAVGEIRQFCDAHARLGVRSAEL